MQILSVYYQPLIDSANQISQFYISGLSPTLSNYQPTSSANSPSSIFNNVLPVDLASYVNFSSAAATYQPKITAYSPLSLTNNTLIKILASINKQ